MTVEVTAWKRVRKGTLVCVQAATFTVYLMAAEVEANHLGLQVVFCGPDRYRLTRGVAYLRTQGLETMADTILAEVHRQEEQQHA